MKVVLCLLVLGACSPQTHIVGSGERDGAAMPTGDGAGEVAANQDGPSATDAPSSSTATDVPFADSAIQGGDVDAPAPVSVLDADAAAKPENDTGRAEPAVDGPLLGIDGAGDGPLLDTSQDRPEEIETPRVDAISAKDSSPPADAIPDAGNSDGPLACPTGGVMPGGTDHCLVNGTGDTGGLQWRVFASTGNPACLTTYEGNASFSVKWNDSGDVVAELGLTLDGKKSYGALGTISAEFAETKAGTAGGFSYIGVHGWSTAPVREYFIVEDWFTPPGYMGSKVSTITVDGALYDVYRLTHVSSNQTFDEYYSVRQSARTCGHISVSEHFKKWEALGLSLGGIIDIKVSVEAGGGQGRIDFGTAMISIQ